MQQCRVISALQTNLNLVWIPTNGFHEVKRLPQVIRQGFFQIDRDMRVYKWQSIPGMLPGVRGDDYGIDRTGQIARHPGGVIERLRVAGIKFILSGYYRSWYFISDRNDLVPLSPNDRRMYFTHASNTIHTVIEYSAHNDLLLFAVWQPWDGHKQEYKNCGTLAWSGPTA